MLLIYRLEAPTFGCVYLCEEQRLYDEERTKVLEAASIHVVRFWNNDVLNSLENVLEELYAHLKVENEN